jgi:hypothetical protein
MADVSVQEGVSCPRCGGPVAKVASFVAEQEQRLVCPFFCGAKGGKACWHVLLAVKLNPEGGGVQITKKELQDAFDASAATNAEYVYFPLEEIADKGIGKSGLN